SSRSARLITKRHYLKHDWCKTERLCNSFYIPREGRADRRPFRSCPACAPRRWKTVAVTFHCPGQMPARRRRLVRLVKKCRCMAQRTGH
ncbi:gremlin-1-like, partial [Pollicipes pollicipes]|uniref:gremlin-1-like n=1 Tax=Pollicipes pollicipes TaxID=41117 RepID=UPI001885359C